MKSKIHEFRIENVKSMSKKLFVLALLVVGMTTYAQEAKPKGERTEKEQFTTEQRNQLRLKKMILALDLNADQQNKMAAIIAEQGAKFETMKKIRQENKAAGKKPTSDEKFAMANKMLDEQIAMKARVKAILNADQFAKWEKMKDSREKKMKGKMRHNKEKKNISNE